MWRRMSLATWRAPNDPQVYVRFEVDVSRALAHLERVRAETGAKVTLTHLTVRAVALALKAFPRANCLIRWGRVYQRRRVDVFCQVAMPAAGEGQEADLGGVVLRDVDTKPVARIAAELSAAAAAERRGDDKARVRTRRLLDWLPGPLYRLALGLISCFGYTLNWNLRPLGVPRDPFGGVAVTSVGGLGIREALGPLVPMTRSPILLALGAVTDTPWAVEGRVEVRPVVVLGVTVDHRILDGFEGAQIARYAQAYLADPAAAEDRIALESAPLASA